MNYYLFTDTTENLTKESNEKAMQLINNTENDHEKVVIEPQYVTLFFDRILALVCILNIY